MVTSPQGRGHQLPTHSVKIARTDATTETAEPTVNPAIATPLPLPLRNDGEPEFRETDGTPAVRVRNHGHGGPGSPVRPLSETRRWRRDPAQETALDRGPHVFPDAQPPHPKPYHPHLNPPGAVRNEATPQSKPQPDPETGGRVRDEKDKDRRPRVLFINQYYWPDHASTAQHLTDLAESLVTRGYDCHVLCSQGTYLGKDAEGRDQERKHPKTEVRNGVTIHRVKASSLGRRKLWTRLTDYLSYYFYAFFRALTLPKYDVVATLTTPPMIGLVGTFLRYLRGSRHVYWSMDLHPDASLELGAMSRTNPIVALLAGISNAIYRHADKVVVLGPYMKKRIAAKNVPDDRMTTIPVWSRSDEVYPLPRAGHPLRRKLGLDDKFVVMYSGNLGLAHTFEDMISAARRLRDRPEIVFLFVGGGPRRSEVASAKEREGLDNILLMDYFPREQLHQSLSLADVHLISMRPEMTGVVVPGKLYGAMASARPTLFIGPDHCETADTIRAAGCGFTVRIGDDDRLVNVIRRLASQPELVKSLGQRGRQAFLSWHEKDVCCAQWSDLLAEMLGIPQPVTELEPDPAAAVAQEDVVAAGHHFAGNPPARHDDLPLLVAS